MINVNYFINSNSNHLSIYLILIIIQIIINKNRLRCVTKLWDLSRSSIESFLELWLRILFIIKEIRMKWFIIWDNQLNFWMCRRTFELPGNEILKIVPYKCFCKTVRIFFNVMQFSKTSVPNTWLNRTILSKKNIWKTGSFGMG